MIHESKEAAKYTPKGTEAEHCGNCSHFEPPKACEIVHGDVVKGGWCRHWHKAAKK